jgi:copper transporter 1
MEVAQQAVDTISATTTTLLGHHKPCHSGGMIRHMMGNSHNYNMANGMDHTMSHVTDNNMHSNMDMGHDMPGMKMCKMSMTLNSDYENLCIITDKIMVTNKLQLLFAMIGIIMFTTGYEFFKQFVDKLQSRYSQFLQSNTVTERERKVYKFRLSCSYALSVGYSFIIMLLFMTFNIWVMLSVCVGAGIGHYLCDAKSSANSLVCH